jgi:hypothetical protein
LPWFDLYSTGRRPDRSELAPKLEDAVISAGTGCDVLVSGGRLPILMLWASVDAEGKVAEASVHPLENVDGHALPSCLEHELSRKTLPATSEKYSFVAPVIVPGRAVETYADSAGNRRPVAVASRSRSLPSTKGSRRSSLTDAESRHLEREFARGIKNMARELKKHGEPQPSAENCATVRSNLEMVRSGGLARAFPHLKKDPNYEKRLQETIRAGEEAERRFCR